MIPVIKRFGHGSHNGPALVRAKGFYYDCQNQADSIFDDDTLGMSPKLRHKLKFDIYFACYSGVRAIPTNRRKFPRIQDVPFEVRVDLRGCYMGRNIWDTLSGLYEGASDQDTKGNRVKLRPYDNPLPHMATHISTICDEIRSIPFKARGLQVLLGGDSLKQPYCSEVVNLCVSDDIPPDMCCLGMDFLSRGVLCFEGACTYFFPITKVCVPPRNYHWPIS